MLPDFIFKKLIYILFAFQKHKSLTASNLNYLIGGECGKLGLDASYSYMINCV